MTFIKKILFKLFILVVGNDRFRDLLRNNELVSNLIRKIPQPSESYENKRIAKSIQSIFNNYDDKVNPNSEKNGKILFMEPRGGLYIRIVMGIIAKRLEYHNYDVSFINCEDLPICNNRSIIFPGSDTTCENCIQQSEDLIKSFKIHSQSLNKLIGVEIRINAEKMTKNLGKREIEDYIYKGFPLGKYINISVCSYLYRGNPEDDEKSVKIMRGFLKGLIILFHAYENILENYMPEKIIMTNGRFFWYKLAYEMCKSRNIPIITMDDFGSTGGTGNYWMFSHDAPVAELDLTTYWSEWVDIPLTDVEKQFLEREFIEKAINNKIYYNDPQRNWNSIISILNIKANSEFDVMYTNLTWDSTAIDRNVCFESMFEWIFITIDEYIKNKRLLLIRVHPAEKGIFGLPSFQKVGNEITKKYKILPSNIKIIPPESQISSYELLSRAKLILVYSSTLGLEATLRGIAVIVAGNVHYRDKGFTYDVSSREEYLAIINHEREIDKINVNQIEIAYRYAFFYLYRSKIPLEFYYSKKFRIYRLNISKYEQLLPGANPYLDLVIDGIVNNNPIVLSRNLTNKLYKLN